MSEGLESLVEVGTVGRSTVITPVCCALPTAATSDLSAAVRDLKLATRAFLQTNPTDQTNAEIILAVRRRLQGD
jgi:hypothetical protein